jgi:hypothetical protein
MEARRALDSPQAGSRGARIAAEHGPGELRVPRAPGAALTQPSSVGPSRPACSERMRAECLGDRVATIAFLDSGRTLQRLFRRPDVISL